MPSDANGVHSLPTGYLAEEGDTIQPSQHNPPLEDISSDLTSRLPRSGVAPMTGPLKLTDGSASSPGLAFNSDPGAGFYLSNGKIIPTRPMTGLLPVGLGPVPWSGRTAPALWILLTGQTLLRASYPDLWTFAQAEIAAGNTLFNNGDGSSTFGVLDGRGRVVAGFDAGNVTGRLNGSLAGGVNAAILGGVGGAQGHQLNGTQIASHFHNNSIIDPGHFHSATSDKQGFLPGSGSVGPGNGSSLQTPVTIVTNTVGTGISIANASAGGDGVHNNVQPTIITNFIMYAGA